MVQGVNLLQKLYDWKKSLPYYTVIYKLINGNGQCGNQIKTKSYVKLNLSQTFPTFPKDLVILFTKACVPINFL